MTINVSQLFAPAALGTSVATYYTVPTLPASNTLMNGKIRFTNVTNGAVTVTAYAIQSGGTAADSNAFMKTESIPANSHVDVAVPMLAAGGFIQALAGAVSSITISCLSGVVFS
jgi:hypothetical protein